MKDITNRDLYTQWVASEDGAEPVAVEPAKRDEPVRLLVELKPYFVAEFLKRVEKFAKIATRHGQVVSAEKLGERQIPHPVHGKRRMVTREQWAVIVPPMVGVKGRIVGHFEQTEDGSSQYVHVFSEADRAACEAILPRAGQCDHCHKNRKRTKTFVVRNGDDVFPVGSNCLIDYLGVDPAWALAVCEWMSTKPVSDEDYDPERPKGSHFIDLMRVVNASYLVARKHGGYSRDLGPTFRQHVGILLWGAFGKEAQEIKREYEGFKPEPLDIQALADYVEGASGDYGSNLRLAFEQEYVHEKRMALVISGVGLFIGRAIKQQTEVKLPAAKAFDAMVGERIEFEAEVVRTFLRDSQFGVTQIISLRTADGRQAVNFHTGMDRPKAGQRYKVKGTIKKHQPAFKGHGDESVLSRCVYKEVA